MCIKINRIVVLIFSIVFLSNTKADDCIPFLDKCFSSEESIESLKFKQKLQHINKNNFQSLGDTTQKDLLKQMKENEKVQNETALKNEENQADDKKIVTNNLSTEGNNNSNNANNETSPLNLEIEEAKSTCADIGFKEGTEKFGECVLKLYSRNKNKKKEMISKKKRRLEEERLQLEQASREARERELERQERQERLRIEKERLALEKERYEQKRRDEAVDWLIDQGQRLNRTGKYAEPTPPPPQNMNCIVIGDNMLSCN